MKRPWQVWLAASACGVLVTAAMAWLTLHALRADRERSAALAAADLEQRVSLALWRMDTKLAPLIAEEVARPHFLYDPYMAYEPARSKSTSDADRVASPLMTAQDANVILNFNATAEGVWESPQAPPPALTSFACSNGMTLDQIESNRARLNELASRVDFDELLYKCPSLPPGQLAGAGGEPQIAAVDELERLQRDAPNGDAGEQAAAPNQWAMSNEEMQKQEAAVQPNGAQMGGGGYGQYGGFGGSGGADARQARQSGQAFWDGFGGRGSRVQEQVSDEFQKQRLENVYRMRGNSTGPAQVIENASRPLWIGDELLLARRVVRDGATMIQGSWLNWPHIKQDLLAETADLIPGADLVPLRAGEEVDPTRMLAGLPVRLVTAEILPIGAGPASPLRWALGIGWGALALAAGAVAALLWGVLALSERRAAFVSSVTHELRTPLTTFRLYAEMLARDMAPTAERRREYLHTLRTEAERLTHLVDNVLSYARLERGRRPRRTERTTPGGLVERFEPRLAERAAAAGMTLECGVDPAAANSTLLTDVSVVEQILFNLVDNAAKYAARATDRRIQLQATREGDYVTLAVRDRGPGFASLRAAERSAPFSKSAEEAAESAPGVGLGLALCRRLARELGGRLAVADGNGEVGATVTLQLPVDG